MEWACSGNLYFCSGSNLLFRALTSVLFKFSSFPKILPIDPVFSNWVGFIKKVSIINCSRRALEI